MLMMNIFHLFLNWIWKIITSLFALEIILFLSIKMSLTTINKTTTMSIENM